ncbi:hypothetical protein Csa_003498, partial [Cucumis sativus]
IVDSQRRNSWSAARGFVRRRQLLISSNISLCRLYFQASSTFKQRLLICYSKRLALLSPCALDITYPLRCRLFPLAEYETIQACLIMPSNEDEG